MYGLNFLATSQLSLTKLETKTIKFRLKLCSDTDKVSLLRFKTFMNLKIFQYSSDVLLWCMKIRSNKFDSIVCNKLYYQRIVIKIMKQSISDTGPIISNWKYFIHLLMYDTYSLKVYTFYEPYYMSYFKHFHRLFSQKFLFNTVIS